MSRVQPLRNRLLLAQGLTIFVLAAGVLGVTLWGARRAVQELSRELVDRAAAEVERNVERLGESATGLSREELLSRLAAIDVSPGAVIAVLDGEGRLLGWSGPIWKSAALARRDLHLQRPREFGVALFDDARKALDSADPGERAEALRFESGGDAWWGRLRLVAVPTGPGARPDAGQRWVAVLIPARDLLADRDRILLAVLGLTALALGLALASANRFGRRVAGPVEELGRRSERIAAGEFEPEAPVTSDIAEIDQLGKAQESMRAGLKTLVKLERDLQLAAQIQRATWPSELPAHPGLEIAAAARPADETGGDGYDLVPIPGEAPHATFLFLADATGHGIGPALSVTQLRAMLRMAVRSGVGLTDLVKPVNDQLCADLPKNRFITAWFGRLDADGRGLESLSAGQAPLLHYHAAEDRLEVFKADLPPLGLFAALPPARSRRIDLAPGDLWVVLSDGFYEAADPEDEEWGVERIGALLRRCRDRPAAEILDELWAELTRFTRGAPAADDQTAILLRRSG